MGKLGPYELNTIVTGDAAQLMATLPEACIDLTVTSPPYDQLRDYHGYTFSFEPIAAELFRVTKPGGVVVWVVGDATVNGSETGTSFRQALGFMGLGFNLHDTMIYHKSAPPLTHNRYEQHFEYMFILNKGTLSTFNPIKIPCIHAGKRSRSSTFRNKRQDGQTGAMSTPGFHALTKIKGNVWFYDCGNQKSTKDKIAFQHPAIFPEALARDHILSWSNPGDVVLDPMCGSGTTCKMAKQLGRRWLGFDIAEEYVELARLRVEQANPPLFTI